MLDGAIEAFKQGFFQKEIMGSTLRKQRAVESGDRTIVGVNKYAISEDIDLELMEVDPRAEKIKIERLREFRKRRDEGRLRDSLDSLKGAASTEENIIPYLIDAAMAMATLGEMTSALKEVFGEYHEGEEVSLKRACRGDHFSGSSYE